MLPPTTTKAYSVTSESAALVFALQALAGDQPTAQPPLRPQQLAPPYTYAQGAQQTWVWPGPPPPACLALRDIGGEGGLASWVSPEARSGTCEEGSPIFLLGTPSIPMAPHSGPLSPLQAPERPMVGVNGLDVTSLRPFDLVIPFTIKKGEITGEWEWEGAREPQRWPEGTRMFPDPVTLPHRGGTDALGQSGTAIHHRQ